MAKYQTQIKIDIEVEDVDPTNALVKAQLVAREVGLKIPGRATLVGLPTKVKEVK